LRDVSHLWSSQDTAFNPEAVEVLSVPNPGEYAFRASAGSEKHLNHPAAIAALQVRTHR